MMHSYVASQRQLTVISTRYLQSVQSFKKRKRDSHFPLPQQSTKVLYSPATSTQLCTGVKALNTLTIFPDKHGVIAMFITAVLVILAWTPRPMATSYWCESTKEDNENSKVRLHHGVHSVERSKIVRHRLLWTFSL